MTQGDVNYALILGFAVALVLWSTIILARYLFPARTALVRSIIMATPLKTGIIGAVITIIAVGGGLAMSNAQPAVIKILGIAIAAWAGVHGILGSAAIMDELADRLSADVSGNKMATAAKAAAMLIAAGLIPLIGWALFFPALFSLSVGGSLGARRAKKLAAAVIESEAQAS
ncbi:MAG: hypothetical protein ACKO14_07390 [Armatimonadota bacterium]